MADIQAIRNAIDEHLALHVAMLGAKSDADTIGQETSEAIAKAKSAFDAANTRAQKTFNTSVDTAKTKRDELVTAEEEKVVLAHTAVVSAEEACSSFRVKVKEDQKIDLPDYGKATSGGHTRL